MPPQTRPPQHLGPPPDSRNRSWIGILCHLGKTAIFLMRVDEAMPTRNVVLTKHQEKIIKTLVGSGRYQNASEVLREGLRLVEQREAEDTAKLEILREAAGAGFGALNRGEFREFDNIDDLQAYLKGLSEKVISGTGE